MLQAVIFDFDGTIAPTSIRQEKWFKHYSEFNGKAWHFKSFDEFLTFYNHHCALNGGVQNVYDKLGLPCDMTDRNHKVWPAYEEFNKTNHQELYPGMKETILKIWEKGQLSKDPKRNGRLRLGINTSNTWSSIYRDLAAADIAKYFDFFVAEETLRKHGNGDCEPLKKPSTYSVELMLEMMGADGKHTLHIGDTINDLIASRNVPGRYSQSQQDLITVGACYGYEGRKRLEQGAEKDGKTVKFDYLIDEPSELVSIVEKLLKE